MGISAWLRRSFALVLEQNFRGLFIRSRTHLIGQARQTPSQVL